MNIDNFYGSECRGELVSLLSDLVKIPSHKKVDGRDQQVNDYITRWLYENGFEVEEKTFGGISLPLGIISGNENNNSIMLNAHTDTVGVEYMENPFSGRYDDKRIYGRGTVDTKGSLAAMMIAARVFKENFKASTDIFVYPSLHEETGECEATEAISKTIKPSYCVVGEPTNLDFYFFHKGLWFFKLISKGLSAHLAVPEDGINAIEHLFTAIGSLKEKYFNPRTKEKDGMTKFTVCSMRGGSEGIPDYAEALYNRRTVPGESLKDDFQNINMVLEEIGAIDPKFDVSVETYPGYETELMPMEPPTDEEFVDLISTSLAGIGNRGGLFPGWTEGSIFRKNDVDTVIFGPGPPAYAHTPFESLEINQLVSASKGYLKILLNHNKRFV